MFRVEIVMIQPLIRAALVLVLVASGATLAAAQADPEARMIALFDRIDTNHDGVISLKEWEAWRARTRERREAHSAGAGNAGDAHLTMNQLAHGAAGATPPAIPASSGTAAAPPTGGERKHPLFDRIDTNHDGKIERDEWIAWVRERMAHRHNHAEAQVQPGPVLQPQAGTASGTAGAPGASAH
jgi:hypothetical protein